MTLAATPRPCERGQMCYVRCPECEDMDHIRHPSEPRKIITSFVYPPIPWRSFDWCAYYDGDEGEEQAPRGWGVTEAAAVKDLQDNFPDEGEA